MELLKGPDQRYKVKENILQISNDHNNKNGPSMQLGIV